MWGGMVVVVGNVSKCLGDRKKGVENGKWGGFIRELSIHTGIENNKRWRVDLNEKRRIFINFLV